MGRRISYQEKEALKDRVILSAVIASEVARQTGSPLKLELAGVSLKALCPLHEEKTPSFKIDDSKGVFHCFGCGQGGDVYEFLQVYGERSFPQALYFLRDNEGSFLNPPQVNGKSYNPRSRSGSSTPEIFNLDYEAVSEILRMNSDLQAMYVHELFDNVGPEAEVARAYLDSRGITPEIREKLGLGFAPANDALLMKLFKDHGYSPEAFELMKKAGIVSESNYAALRNRITFPLSSVDGIPFGFFGRTTSPNTSGPKYRNTPDSVTFSKRALLFGLHNLDPEQVGSDGLYLVEGGTDVVGFFEQGLNNVLYLGSTNLTPGQIGIIDYLSPKKVFIVTDGDGAGISGSLRNANILLGAKTSREIPVELVPLPTKEDPFDLFFTKGVDIREYVADHSLTPRVFLEKRLPALRKQFTSSRGFDKFISDNTDRIISLEDLVKLDVVVPEQRETSIPVSVPHYRIVSGIHRESEQLELF